MQHRTLTLLSFLLAVAFLVHLTDAKCGSCQTNGIACIDTNRYRVCYGDGDNKIQSTEVFTCPTGVCSRFQEKCVEIGVPFCNPEVGCDVCNPEKQFTCTSRTTFALCNGNEVTDQIGKCPKGSICDSTHSGFCRKTCGDESNAECDRAAAIAL